MKYFKKLTDAQDSLKGSKGAGGQGTGEGGGGGGGKGQPLTPRTLDRAKKQLASDNKTTGAVAEVKTKKQITEDTAFAATGRITCNKRECKDESSWNIKNHRDCDPLPKMAAAHGDAIPGTYGQTRKVKPGGEVDDEGCSAVGGEFVEKVPPPPAPYVQPAPFGEDDDEEE